ncbi:hypothetical protein NP233_g906 [Leucocoprinus birnbaumii]|uniref:Uncharacterized protein n=1 Tax=Leucocoprinus birnbaumii TaxID=56174 RepID=A0AAD5YYD6_9AGAR|nr:hypothetical protein NP233_g906 [Leucocoprinus birnbaumii]
MITLSSIDEYCERLGKLYDEATQLERASGFLLSIKMLKRQLSETKCAFLLNAASLAPSVYDSVDPYIALLAKNRTHESLPTCMLELAVRFQNFRHGLEGFHERTDEAQDLHAHLTTFIKRIKYRAHCLSHYADRLNTIPIQQYAHHVAQEVSFGLSELVPTLDSFTSIGVPVIKHGPKRASDRFLQISAVSTLFSSVAASMLQVSSGAGEGNEIAILAVNYLWLCSLVFSIGATINGMLAMFWKQASRGSRAPDSVKWWMNTSPTAFLALAIACFSAGVLVYVYALKGHLFAAPVMIMATTMTFIGLVAAAFGLLYGRWISNPIYQLDKTDIEAPPDDVASIASGDSLTNLDGDWFDEEHGLPTVDPTDISASTKNLNRFKRIAKNIVIQQLVLKKMHTGQMSRTSPLSATLPHTRKFKATVNRVLSQNSGCTRMTQYLSDISIPSRHGSVRFMMFAPEAPLLAITCVKDEKFSSLTWSAIYDVATRTPVKAADMWHSGESCPMQGKGLSWSPDGKELLVRFDRELHIWDFRRGQLRKILSRRTIRAFAWLDANTILLAERCKIYKQSRSQRTMDEYELPYLSIRDIAVETNHNYLVILARVKDTDEQALPMEERKQEKRIIVYDMDKKKAVYQLPVLEDITSLQIPRSGLRMLASFQAWEFDANIDSSDLRVIPVLRRLNLVHPTDSPEEEYTSAATFGGVNDTYIFSATTGGKIRAWRHRGHTPELQSSFMLSLGVPQEGEEPQLIEQLAWRSSTPTFAVTFLSTGGTSTVQLWMVPGNTTHLNATPVIRTTSSQGSTVSAFDNAIDRHLSPPPSPRTPISRMTPTSSPPVGFGLIDVVTQVAPRHSHGGSVRINESQT